MINRIIIVFALSLSIVMFSCEEKAQKNHTEENKEITKNETRSPNKFLDSLININPKQSNLYYERSRLNYDRKFYPKALVDILSAIKLDSSQVNYYLLGGDIYIEMQQGEDAIKLMSKGINLNPNNEELYLRAVEYNFLMNKKEAAMNFANDLLRINKNNAEVYFFKGLIYKNDNNKDKAISNFQTCVEQDPTFYNAYMQLGVLFSERNDDLSINYFDNALRLEPESREALYGKAYHFQQTEEYNKAKKVYKQMVTIRRRDHQAFYNMGHCFLAQDSLAKADKSFYLATKAKPEYVDAMFMQGQIAERIGDIPSAKIHYQNALKLLPDNKTLQDALKAIQ